MNNIRSKVSVKKLRMERSTNLKLQVFTNVIEYK